MATRSTPDVLVFPEKKRWFSIVEAVQILNTGGRKIMFSLLARSQDKFLTREQITAIWLWLIKVELGGKVEKKKVEKNRNEP